MLMLFAGASSEAFPEIHPLPKASGGGKKRACDAVYGAGKTHLRAAVSDWR